MKELFDTNERARITQAIEEMKAEAGDSFCLEKLNLAELERRTGVTRSRLRRLKDAGFEFRPHGNTGKASPRNGLVGYSETLDKLLKNGVTNSSVCLERLQAVGYTGGATAVKVYIAAHKDLVPATRHLVEPQGNRGRRYAVGVAAVLRDDLRLKGAVPVTRNLDFHFAQLGLDLLFRVAVAIVGTLLALCGVARWQRSRQSSSSISTSITVNAKLHLSH